MLPSNAESNVQIRSGRLAEWPELKGRSLRFPPEGTLLLGIGELDARLGGATVHVAMPSCDGLVEFRQVSLKDFEDACRQLSRMYDEIRNAARARIDSVITQSQDAVTEESSSQDLLRTVASARQLGPTLGPARSKLKRPLAVPIHPSHFFVAINALRTKTVTVARASSESSGQLATISARSSSFGPGRWRSAVASGAD